MIKENLFNLLKIIFTFVKLLQILIRFAFLFNLNGEILKK
jgi:hypothetical protein